MFDHQPRAYETDSIRVAYVVNLLTGRALQWADALAESGADEMHSYQRFIQALREVFDHSSSDTESAHRLYTLRQGALSVAEYSIEFRILATESGWNDVALRRGFYEGLSESLKDVLMHHDPPESLEESVNLAIRLDNRFREQRRARRDHGDYAAQWSSPPRHTRPAASRAPERPPEREWRSTGRPDHSPPASTSEPLQLGQYRLSDRERQRRIRDRLCMYCGQRDHQVNQCPVRGNGRARQ